MGFKFASKQSHHSINGRHLVLVGHHQTLYAIVDTEHIQGIRTGKQVEDHIVLGNKTVEELDRLGIDAVIAIGKHGSLLNADHHQIVGLQLLQPISGLGSDVLFFRHERSGGKASFRQAVIHIVFGVSNRHNGNLLVIGQWDHIAFITQQRDGFIIKQLTQLGIGGLLQVGHQIGSRHRFIMVEAHTVFVTQDLLTALLKPCSGLFVAFSCRFYGLDGKRHVGRQDQDVVARHKSHVRHAVLTHFLRNAFHVEAVGENQAFEAHLFFQKVGDHAS